MCVNGCYRQISILAFLFYLLCVHYAICEPKERENRHLFPLLGYLHGYKIGQNFAYQLPPFVLSPVVILPTVNQQQSVNVQKSTSGENYHETGGTFQIISPSRLVSNLTEAIYKDNDIEENEVENDNSVSLNQTNVPKDDSDTFRQAITNDTDATTVKSTETDYPNTTEVTNNEIENFKLTSPLLGPYPTAGYKNENLSTLSITTAPFKDNSTLLAALLPNNLTLPIVEKKQNFSEVNTTGHKSTDGNGTNNIAQENSNIYPPSFSGYSYPNPWYSSVADKLSITNPYTNYESPLQPTYDDRWQSFSSLRKSYPTSDFRPLAGLYHDGFLHKHVLKKTGFIPVVNKYSYYN